MKEKLKLFIDNNMEVFDCYEEAVGRFKTASLRCERAMSSDINNFVNETKSDNKFQKLLFKYIDDRGLKDSDVYNKIHMDRRLFSKIRSDDDYHPSKETIILLGLSLELNVDEIIDLLESASYSLPKNNYYDLIIRFCFMEGIYKIRDVNDLLSMYGCKLFSY